MSFSGHPHTALPRSIQRLTRATLATSIPAIVTAVVFEGYELFAGQDLVAVSLWWAAVAVSVVYQAMLVRRAVDRRQMLRTFAADVVLLGVVVLFTVLWVRELLALAVFLRQTLAVARIGFGTERGRRWGLGVLSHPAKLIAVSFLVLIALGTLCLTFPRATTDGQGTSLVDATFTATSATCVTGLAVLNTNDDAASDQRRQSFSPFGQAVILMLIQVGGLGIMTLSAAVVLLLGRRLGMRSQALLQQVMEESSRRDLERSIRFIVQMTLIVETAGAVILFFRFWPVLGDAEAAAVYAIFTSVSAYCNAGFSLWSDSLTGFRSDWVVMFTVMGLITAGGIGFTVVAALADPGIFRRLPAATWRRWPVHVRVVLTVSLALVVGGWVVYYFLEFHESLDGLSRGDRIVAALFQSVTMRTAGFNTVDFGQLGRVTLVAMLLLMMIGGSSGSTAGGVKTSTVAVVFLSVRAMLGGRDDVEVGGRTIPKTIVYKSVSILVIFVLLFIAGLTGLLLTQPAMPFEALLFETMSALATVGVSMGITPDLSPAGKMVVIFLMFVGRIGPLTLALAVGEKSGRVSLRYPEGKIMVG